MSKKNDTVKQKKLEKKEKQAQLNLAWKSVEKANLIDDPLKELPAFRKFARNGLEFNITNHWKMNIDPQIMDSMFCTLKDNMKQFYEACNWGWNDKKKLEEMTDDNARYLMAKDESGNLVAFSHYRFDLDFDVEVLYIYELQLIPSVRKCGLGKFMLQILELIAFKNNMKKVMLTVLKNNPDALQFFKSMKYTIDDTSPPEEEDVFDHYSYIILSKRNKKFSNEYD